MKNILFVCTGNICRSPTAEGIFRYRVEKEGLSGQFNVDSAGTQGFHSGEAPDYRAVEVAAHHSINLKDLRARKLQPVDFNRFDLILAMDSEHLRHLQRACPDGAPAELALFLDYAGAGLGRDVPDPYYGSIRDFEETFNLIAAGATSMLKRFTS